MDNVQVAQACVPTMNGRCTAHGLCELLQSLVNTEAAYRQDNTASESAERESKSTDRADSRQSFKELKWRLNERALQNSRNHTRECHRMSPSRRRKVSSSWGSSISSELDADLNPLFSRELLDEFFNPKAAGSKKLGMHVVPLKSFFGTGVRHIPALMISSDTIFSLCIPSKEASYSKQD